MAFHYRKTQFKVPLKKNLFISRRLKNDSPLLSLKDKYNIIDISLIKITSIEVAEIPKATWLFFYSKNGVKYFVQNARRLHSDLKPYKIGHIGQQTAKYAQQLNLKADFIGPGDGQSCAEDFIPLLKPGDTLLFPCATNSQHSLRPFIPKTIRSVRLDVYSNQPKNKISLPNIDLAVLTSPLNASVFIENYKGESLPDLISIGKTTAKTIVKLSQQSPLITKEPNEESILMTIQSIISQD